MMKSWRGWKKRGSWDAECGCRLRLRKPPNAQGTSDRQRKKLHTHDVMRQRRQIKISYRLYLNSSSSLIWIHDIYYMSTLFQLLYKGDS
jgi:hypothetical protein